MIVQVVSVCGSVCGLCSLGQHPDYLKKVISFGVGSTSTYMYSVVLTRSFTMAYLYRKQSHPAKDTEIHHRQGASKRPDPQDQACIPQGQEEAVYS